MIRVPFFSSRRAIVTASLAIGAAVTSAAGAATVHRLAVSSASGSGGASAVLQSTASGSALQGEVASSANTGIKIPFGVLGEFNPSGTPPFGIGVIGISATGYGVAAESFGSNPTMLALAGANGIGVAGVTNSPAAAVYGENKGAGDGGAFFADGNGNGIEVQASGSGPGILVSGTSGDGIFASSQSGFAIEVDSAGGDGVHSAVENTNATGVVGVNNAAGIGVDGVSVGGFGTQGQNVATASPPPGAQPETYAGSLGVSVNGPGMFALNLHDQHHVVGYGDQAPVGDFAALYAFANDGAGVYAYSNIDFGGVFENDNTKLPPLLINAQDTTASGLEIEASAGNLATDVPNFTVDRAGNVTHTGSVNAISRNPNTDVATYSAQQTESTVEDLGTAQLVNGIATVRMPDDFRSTTDGSSRYMVFLTPYAENDGLYIASRSAIGFTVREGHGGRSSLAFDYRVVAHPYGSARDVRLPHLGRRLLAEAKLVRGAAGNEQRHSPQIAPPHAPQGVHAHRSIQKRLPASALQSFATRP